MNLMYAAHAGDALSVQTHLEAGANPNYATQSGMTVLMNAASNGHIGVVRLLLDHGAEINKKRNDGLTALALAVFFGHKQVVRELVARGADIEDDNRFGTSAEMWASARGFKEIAQLLREARTNRARQESENEVHESMFQETLAGVSTDPTKLQRHVSSILKDDQCSSDPSEVTIEVTRESIPNVEDGPGSRAVMMREERDAAANARVASVPNDSILNSTVLSQDVSVKNNSYPFYSTYRQQTSNHEDTRNFRRFPLLETLRSDWQHITITTLIVVLVCSVGTIALLKIINGLAVRRPLSQPHDVAKQSEIKLKESSASPTSVSSSSMASDTVTKAKNMPVELVNMPATENRARFNGSAKGDVVSGSRSFDLEVESLTKNTIENRSSVRSTEALANTIESKTSTLRPLNHFSFQVFIMQDQRTIRSRKLGILLP